jgi:hypothetical protein
VKVNKAEQISGSGGSSAPRKGFGSVNKTAEPAAAGSPAKKGFGFAAPKGE